MFHIIDEVNKLITYSTCPFKHIAGIDFIVIICCNLWACSFL